MPCDMLVKLYTVQEDEALLKRLKEDGILIKRALPPILRRCASLPWSISARVGQTRPPFRW